MLDNLGLGEFFFLALMALLFFGPQRLPQIGARLGRWIRSLTQYSSAFLNEWRDEALAVHDAVREVKGIRDEIAAARAEIAGTLDTARTEMGDAVSGATRDVQEQVKRSTQVLPKENPLPEPPTEEGTGTDIAIAKTQAILDGLGDGQAAGSVPALLQAPDGGQAAGNMPALPHALETLGGQVETLRGEMRGLQAELAQIRARIEARRARTRSEQASGAEKEKALVVAPPAAEPVGEVEL